MLGASLAGKKKYAEAKPLLREVYQGMLARKDQMEVSRNRYHLDRASEWLVRPYQGWASRGKRQSGRENKMGDEGGLGPKQAMTLEETAGDGDRPLSPAAEDR